MISINILNYNTFEKSKNCIMSCLSQKGVSYKIILIDNHSSDDSLGKLKIMFKDKIDFLENEENYGFAKGNNIGVNYAYSNGYKYCLLLNSDITLTSDTTLLDLYQVMKNNPNCAVVSPFICNVTSKGPVKIEHDYGYIRILRMLKILPSNHKVDDGLVTASEAHGSAMFIDNNKFIEIGGFPESYFMYGEESTFSKQLLWSGYEIIKVLSTYDAVYHHHDKSGKTSEWIKFLMGRNEALEYYDNKSRAPIRWFMAYHMLLLKRVLNKERALIKGAHEGRKLFFEKASNEERFISGRMYVGREVL